MREVGAGAVIAFCTRSIKPLVTTLGPEFTIVSAGVSPPRRGLGKVKDGIEKE